MTVYEITLESIFLLLKLLRRNIKRGNRTLLKNVYQLFFFSIHHHHLTVSPLLIMGIFSSKVHVATEELGIKVADRHADSLWVRLQSSIILFLVLFAVGGVIFVTYKIFTSVRDGINKAMEAKNINVSRTSASIGVHSRSQQSVVDSAQRYVYKAWENSQPQEEAKVSRLFRLREWKDRKRDVYQGSGTEAANSGW